MARTRTSTSDWESASHRARAVARRYGKPLLYIYLLGVGVGGWVRGVHAGQPDAAAPCVACQILSLPPEQADALPPALGGLRIVARVAPGGAAPRVSSVLDAVRRRGGVGGLHVTAVPDEADPLLA